MPGQVQSGPRACGLRRRAQHRRNGRALRHHERSGRLAPAGAALVVSAVIAHVASLLAMTRSPPLRPGGRRGLVLRRGRCRAGRRRHARRDWMPPWCSRARRSICSTGWGSRSSAPSSCCGPWCCAPGSADDAPGVARYVLALTAGGLAMTVAALVASPLLASAHLLAAGLAAYLAGTAASLLPAGAGNAGQATAYGRRLGVAGDRLAGRRARRGHRRTRRRPRHGQPGARRAADPRPRCRGGRPVLARALTFLLPVTAGGGPAGNRRLTGILERGWRTRAILGNAGVLP